MSFQKLLLQNCTNILEYEAFDFVATKHYTTSEKVRFSFEKIQ